MSRLSSRRRFAGLLSGALGAVACGNSGKEAKYPSREIKMIIQAGPGGISDTVSRVIASLAEPVLGVPVVCENKPGASGALAFSYLSRRPADGYSIGHAPVEIATVRALGYAPLGPENFDLLCLVSRTQACLAVKQDSRWENLESFVTGVSAKPEYYIVGNSGTGSIWHINSLLLERAAQLQFVHLPFPGSAGAITAALGGHIDAVVAGVGEVVTHVNAGRMRVLSVFGPERSDLFPEVRASREAGYDFGAPAWSGFFGPKGLPTPVRDSLTAALRQAWESEGFRKVCQERGLEAEFLPPEEFTAFATSQAQFFRSQLAELLGTSVTG